MKFSALAVGLLAALAAAPANATVLFSTVHPPTTPNSTRLVLPGTGTTPVARGGPIGESFYVPAATTITSVQLQLTSNNPSDGGSVLVYLVPNTGGSTGVAGLPTYTGTGSSLALTGAIQIGSILDSALPNTTAGTLQTFNTYQPVAAGEYWLVAQNMLGASGIAPTAKWVFDQTAYTSGTGMDGQEVFFQAGGGTGAQTSCATGGVPCAFLDTLTGNNQNLYLAEVDAPEPLSIALLGAGLAGLGIVRRGGQRG